MQVCEQLFSWLAGYKAAVRHMSQPRFLWFIICMCGMHNEEREDKLAADGVLFRSGTAADLSQPRPVTVCPPRPDNKLYSEAHAHELLERGLPTTLDTMGLYDMVGCLPGLLPAFLCSG